MNIRCLMVAALSAAWCLCGLAAAEVTLFAAPEAAGKGDGSSAGDPMRVWDARLWKKVRTELKDSAVTLELAPGTYYTQYPAKPDTRLDLSDIGNDRHVFTMRGAPNRATVFSRHPGDSMNADPKSKNLQSFIVLRKNCRNIVIERLFFTGKGMCGYALQVRDSHHVTIRDCHWKDMRGIYYGASGANLRSSDITWKDCTFENIGYNSHAHMLYNANECRGLKVENCVMTDAFGDYIRFRNRVDNVTIRNCVFVDNGKYVSSPFIAFPIFNKIRREYFSTGLSVTGCTFVFKKKGPRNWMMDFHISGYNPPDRQYLVSKRDAARFAKMSRAEQRKFLDDRFGLETARIEFADNKLANVNDAVVYECWPIYGAEKEFPPEEYKNVLSLTRALMPEAK